MNASMVISVLLRILGRIWIGADFIDIQPATNDRGLMVLIVNLNYLVVNNYLMKHFALIFSHLKC